MIRRTAAGGGVRASRILRHRHRCPAVQSGAINRGESYIQDVPTADVQALVKAGKIRATTDFSVVRDLDIINIWVPTPLRKTKDPDMSFIVNACQEMAKFFHPGTLVILESTTYPGTTDELMLPMFEEGGLKVGQDFFMCFSPERVDPGNPKYQTKNISKVVGGITSACTEIGALFYRQALDTVVPVGSTRVAEMVKLLENTFRMINIGLVNEIALMCDRIEARFIELGISWRRTRVDLVSLPTDVAAQEVQQGLRVLDNQQAQGINGKPTGYLRG